MIRFSQRVLLFLLITCGCEESQSPGRVEFDWRLGAQGCDFYGVTDVKASLFGFEQVEPMLESNFNCATGSGSFESVSPGEYALVLEGLNADGCPTHSGREDLIVGSGQTIQFDRPVSLLRFRRPIALTWNFENRLDCRGNDVSQVEILVEIDDVDSYSEARVCAGFSSLITEEFLPGDTTISIFGINDIGERVVFGQTQLERDEWFEEPCNDTVNVLVMLAPCEQSNCE